MLGSISKQAQKQGPRAQGKGKIWRQDQYHMVSQISKPRVRTKEVYLNKYKCKTQTIESQISTLKNKGQNQGSIFKQDSGQRKRMLSRDQIVKFQRKILGHNYIVFNLKSQFSKPRGRT